jgi:GDP-L-fucose synthase
MPTAITGKRVFVAGHRGMVGSALVRRLSAMPDVEVLTVPRAELDLTERGAVRRFLEDRRPDIVIVAAAKVGGIMANSTQPVAFLEENLRISTNLISGSHAAGVEKLLYLGSSCIYPKHAPQPIREESLLSGPLEPTNQWYAIAKIAGVMLCDAYRREHGANFVSAMPTNLYGPNDNYDPVNSHVMAALIRRVHEASRDGRGEVTLWGTGTPLREFMHVDDLADACLLLVERYEEAGPINVGSGVEITIRELADKVAGTVGWRGRFVHDLTKPDGTPRKLMDSTRLREGLGWAPRIDLAEGLPTAYADFLKRYG